MRVCVRVRVLAGGSQPELYKEERRRTTRSCVSASEHADQAQPLDGRMPCEHCAAECASVHRGELVACEEDPPRLPAAAPRTMRHATYNMQQKIQHKHVTAALHSVLAGWTRLLISTTVLPPAQRRRDEWAEAAGEHHSNMPCQHAMHTSVLRLQRQQQRCAANL